MERNFAVLDTSNPWFKGSVYVEDRSYEFYVGYNVQNPTVNWVGVSYGSDHHSRLLEMEDEIKEQYKVQLGISSSTNGLSVYNY